MSARKRLSLSAPLAVGLAIALSSQALAASWSAPAVLDATGLVAVSDRLLVVYDWESLEAERAILVSTRRL